MDLTTLPDEVKELVRAQLEAGRFESVDEIVIEALRLLQERDELFASHREQLRAQIAEGVAAEERGELRDGREAIADVRRRIERLEQRTIDHEGEAVSESPASLRHVRTVPRGRPHEPVCGRVARPSRPRTRAREDTHLNRLSV